MKTKHELTQIQINSYEYRGWRINVYRELERTEEGRRKTNVLHAVVSNWQKVFDKLNPEYDKTKFWDTKQPVIYPVAAQTGLQSTDHFRGQKALTRCLKHAKEIIDRFEDSKLV